MRDKFNSVSISQSDIKSSLKSGAINRTLITLKLFLKLSFDMILVV
jgi:hypothetical protein